MLSSLLSTRRDLIAEANNRRYYNTYGRFYEEYHAYFRNTILLRQWKNNLNLIKNKISFPQKMKALDFGCGTGLLSLMLLDLGFFVTAVDVSEEMLCGLKKNVLKLPRNVHNRIQYIHGGINILQSLQPETFHLVCESSVMHHLDNYIAFLISAERMIIPGGVVYIGREPLITHEQRTHKLNKYFVINNYLSFVIRAIDKYYNRTQLRGRFKEVFDISIQPAYEKGGVSCEAFINAGKKMGMNILFKKIYNWRRSKQAFFIDNLLPRALRKEGFWCTFFDIALQKAKF